MASWGFLTNHARVLLCIAHDPAARLRDLAAGLGITERSACAIVTDLAQAGYVIKQKDGRRNRYQIGEHLPLPEPGTREPPSAKSSPCCCQTPVDVTGRGALPPRAGQTAWTAPPPGRHRPWE
jgi:hypothetical protein